MRFFLFEVRDNPDTMPFLRDWIEEFATLRMIYFGSVFKSMSTVVRIIFGDTSDVSGRPLAVYFGEIYGIPALIAYLLVMVVMTLGAFNVIASLFVQRVSLISEFSEADRRYHIEQQQKAAQEKARKLVWKVCAYQLMAGGTVSKGSDPKLFQVSRDVFLTVMEDEEVATILDELHVFRDDRPGLFDMLDENGNGYLEVNELINGFLHLGGGARKVDLHEMSSTMRRVAKKILTGEENDAALTASDALVVLDVHKLNGDGHAQLTYC